MAYGTINVDTLTASTGVLATQNGMTGIAKAWVKFNGGANSTTAGNILSSFNVSSITVIGTGQYTINFTTAMPNANYACVVGGLRDSTDTNVVALISTPSPTTTTQGISTGTASFAYVNYNIVSAVIISS